MLFARPILLFGANGQLGTALQPRLATLGSVLAAKRQDVDLGAASTYEDAATSAAASPGVDDAAQEERAAPPTTSPLIRYICERRPAVLINAAAYTAVDKAETETTQAALVNTAAPMHMAAAAARLGIPLIHYSTDYVFPGTGQTPWREDAPTGPLNAYGRSKLAGEAAALASGGAVLVVRTSWVFSATGTNFLRTMLRLAATQPSLRIVADQIGAPTSADFLADATVHMLRVGAATGDWQTLRGIYHLSCSGETSWHGFATEIFAAARRHGLPLAVREVHPIASSDYPQSASRPANSRLDHSRFSRVFGLTCPSWQAETERVARQIAAAVPTTTAEAPGT